MRPLATRSPARRRQILLGLPAVAVLLAVLAAGQPPSGSARASAASTAAPDAWTTYGGSSTRTSDAAGPSLRRLRLRWRTGGLSGPVYGEPLIWGGEVLVATERDEVVAFHAATGRVAWRRSLGTPVPADDLPCGDIAPTVGVTSTMVLDPARHALFASAETLVDGRVHHVLAALDARNGRLEWRRDLDQPRWDPPAQLQRAALALARGRVVVGFGGNYGDCGPYHGYVMAAPESGKGPILSYRVPTAREGGIWAPSGVSVAANGDIYAATGNGSSTTRYDSGNSVLELSPTLRRLASFAPSSWAADNAADRDLGSAAPMVLPGERLLVVGKGATGYLLDATHLGGIGHPLASAPVCFSIGGDAYANGLAYVACPGGRLTAVRVEHRHLGVAWHAPRGVDESPTLAGGLLWSLAGGTLDGLAPRSGRLEVARPAVATERYVAPSAAEGLLVVAGTHAVEAFEGSAGYRRGA